MKKRILALILVVLLVVLSACSSGGNNVSKAYDEAMNLMMQGKYTEASEKLSGITYYLDSYQLSRYCRAHAWAQEGKYDDAISELETLTGFRDASQCAVYYSARKAEDSADTPSRRARAADLFDRAEINGFRDAPARAAKIRSALYQDGANAENAEKWDEAAAAFEALNDYQDSEIRWYYTTGRSFEIQGESQPVLYARAAVMFHSAGEYRDAADRKKSCLDTAYARADEMIKAENFTVAREIYMGLDSLCDTAKFTQLDEAIAAARERERQKRIAEADALVAQEKFDEAREIYLECKEPGMANEAMYLKAAWLEKNGETEKAAGVYMDILTYKDSREKHYLLGKGLAESDPETASRILLEDREYPGAADDLYAIALAATEAENWPLSIAIYTEFDATRDCSLRLLNDLYLYGRKLLEGDEPEHAAEVFDQLKGVGSADLYANMARYAAAEALEKKGQYAAAAKAFDSISGYADAADRANLCRYQDALERKKNGRYKEAAGIFLDLGDLKDSAQQRTDCLYLLAGEHAENSRWEDAIAVYEGLGDYLETKAKCMECYRKLGWQQMDEGQPEEAYASFVAAGDADAQAQAAFAAGEQCVTLLNLNGALKWYELAPGLPETEERVAMVARSLLNMEEDALSESYASIAVNSEKNQAVLYALALRSLERKDEETAMRQLKKAGDNADASERFQEMLGARVDALVAEERFDDAVFLCSTYGDQERVEQIQALKAQKEEEEQRKAEEAEQAAREARKQEAASLLEAGKYEEAAALYTEIGEKELADGALAKKAEAEEALRAEEEAERARAEEAEREKLRAKEEEAAAQLEAGKYDEAIAAYTELNDREMMNESVYRKAAALDQPELYLQIPEYKDSRDKHYQAGKALLDSDPEKAFRILADDITYGDTQAVLYDLAGKESESGHYLLSSAIYEKLAGQPLDPQNPRSDCRMRSVQDMYRYGMQLKEQGDFETAAVIFDQLAGTGEAAEHSRESYYAIAGALEESGKYSQAAVAFEALGTYSDAADRAKQCRYTAAKKQLDSGNYDSAEIAFLELRNFSDAAEMAKNCRYQKAGSLFEAGKYAEAKEIYDKLGDYQTSGEMSLECMYRIAEQLLAGEQYPEAIAAYESVGDYSDAAEKLKACHSALGGRYEAQAESFLQEGSTEKAAEAYQSAYAEYGFAGDAEKADAAAMHIAECCQSVNELDSAVTWLMTARKHPGTIPHLEAIAAYYESTEQAEKAEYIRQIISWVRAGNAMDEKDYLGAIGYYAQISDPDILKNDAKEAYYYYGLSLMYEGKPAEAAEAFILADDYPDAADQLKTAWIAVGYIELEAGNYQGAREAFEKAGSAENIQEAWQREADALFAAGNYEDARNAYEQAGLTEQVKAVWTAEGDACLAAGQYAEARNAYKQAGLTEQVTEAWKLEGEACLAAGQYKQAREAFSSAGMTDKVKEVWRLEGETCLASGQYAQARVAYSNAGMTDKVTEVWNLQGEAWLADGEYEQARNAFTNAGNTDGINRAIYAEANHCMETGEYYQAYSLYMTIPDYPGVQALLDSDPNLVIFKVQVGSIVTFGSYEQDNNTDNGTEPIEWLVLKVEEGKAMLISVYGLDTRQYNLKKNKNAFWQTSDIRLWLNGDFQKTAFNENEQARICLTRVGNSPSQLNGNDSDDHIFLLSEDEATKWLPADRRSCKPTAYTVARGAKVTLGDCTGWWLRDHRTDRSTIVAIDSFGSVANIVSFGEGYTVRPAMWITIQ